MKNIRRDLDDALRPEYKRSDFGEMVTGKYALTQVEFAEMVHLFLTCIGEDEGIKFTHNSPGNQFADRHPGDWTYEMDNTNQVTLRYWRSELENVEERLSNLPCVTTAEERSELQALLLKHVRALKHTVKSL